MIDEPIKTTDRRRPLLDIGIVFVASAIAFMAESSVADHLPWGAEARGVVAVLVGTAIAIWLTYRHGGNLSSLGFTRPKSWVTAPLWAVGILVTFIAAQGLVPALLGTVFDVPQPDMSRYDSIRGNLPAALGMAIALPLFAAIPEEILYRGFLIDRLSALLGRGGMRSVSVVLLQAVIFGSVHFQWGLGGVVMTTIMGIVWGSAFLLCGRNLWIVIIAHAGAHLLLVAQLYSAPAAG